MIHCIVCKAEIGEFSSVREGREHGATHIANVRNGLELEWICATCKPVVAAAAQTLIALFPPEVAGYLHFPDFVRIVNGDHVGPRR